MLNNPSDPRLSGIYGTILFDELGSISDRSLHQRSLTIFADGEVERSPSGSGSASRVAVLTARGQLSDGHVLVHDSIVGSRFTCSVTAMTSAHGRSAVMPNITGMAFKSGSSHFTVDPRDSLVPGFVLR
jgi:proline racemase